MSQRTRGFSYFALGALFALMLPLLIACGPEAAQTTAPAATAAATTAPVGATTPTTAATRPAGTTTAASPAVGASPRPSGSPAAATPRPSGSPSAAAGDMYPSGGKYSTVEPIGRRGGHVTEVAFADAATLSSVHSSDTASGLIIAMLGNSLLEANPEDGSRFGDLAESVPSLDNGGISKDGLTYTFRLRRNVRWHDGRPFTSRDVLFTYQTMMNPQSGSPRTSQLNARLESVTAPDEYTVVFKTKTVVAPLLYQDMGYEIMPQHILGNVPVDQIRAHPFSTGDPAQTIYTGPFKFKEWVKDDHITLVKNPDYFRGEPALDEWVYRVVRDANVVAATLKTGEADYGGITPALFEEMSREPNINTIKWDAFGFTFISFNLDAQKTPLFQDKRVRQALSYSLDRDAMVQAILFGLGTVAHGTMPTPSWAYAADQLRTKITYDPQRASRLLDEAGWRAGPDGIRVKDGQRLSFAIWTNAGNVVRANYLTAMQQQWRAIGVEATPRTEEWNAFLTRITEVHDFEIFLVGFQWGVDPDQTTMWHSNSYNPPGTPTKGFNMNKYANQRVDQLLDQGLQELDQERRKQLYLEMQEILMDELPNLIIDFPQGPAGLNKRVKNMFPNAINRTWNAHTWWVTDGR